MENIYQNQSKAEHYNLKWNNYTNHLLQVFSEHQHHERLVDVTLVCEGQYIKAHKLVLSAFSTFFQDMFKLHGGICGSVLHPFIILNDVKFTHIKHIIEFMYQGEIKVLDSDLEGVLALGEKFQIKGLSSIKLKQKINVDPKNVTQLPPPPKESSSQTPTNEVFPNPNKNHPLIPLSVLTQPPNIEPPIPLLHNHKMVSVIKPISNNTAHTTSETFESPRTRAASSSPQNCTSDSETHAKKKLKAYPSAKEKRKSPENTPRVCEVISDVRSSQNSAKAIRKSIESNELDSKDNISNTDSDDDKTLKPTNAFMIFANEWRKKLAVEHPDESNKEISIRLGNIWSSLSAETKESYYRAAERFRREIKPKQSSAVAKKRKLERRQTIESLSDVKIEETELVDIVLSE